MRSHATLFRKLLTSAAIIPFLISSNLFGNMLAPELRPHAEHEMRSGHESLATGIDLKEVEKFKEPSQVSSSYRLDPSRSGINQTDMLSTELKMKWRVPFINVGIHSASKASPAVDKSGIYIGSDSSWFFAYDLEGNFRWRKHIPHSSFGIHGTASLDQHKVYFGAYNGVLYALNKQDGKLVWSQKLGDAIGSSPILYENHLYIAVETNKVANGYIAKVNSTDGKIVWISPHLGEQAHSSPVINAKDRLVHVGANNGTFFGIDLETGHIKWSFLDGKAIKNTGTLVQRNGGEQLVCFGSWSGLVHCLDAKNGSGVWETLLDSHSRTSPTYIPALDYLVTASELGTIYALKMKDGKEVWKIQTGNKNLISSSLIIRSSKAEGSGWVMWDTCEKYYLCAIDPKSGSVQKRYDMHGSLTSVPVYFDGSLYLALNREGGLLRFDQVK